MPALFSLIGGVALAAALLVGALGGVGVGLSLGGGSSEPSPPDTSDDLEPVARVVGTEAESAAVRSAVRDLNSAVERVAEEANVTERDPVDRANAVESAVDAGELTTGDGAEPEPEPALDEPADDGGDVVASVADTVGRERSPRSRSADRLLTYLSDPANVREEQLRETLATAVADLDELAAMDEALSALPDDPDGVADRLTSRLDGESGERAAALREVGDRLAATAEERATCRETRQRLETAGGAVCSAASGAGVYLEGDEPAARLESLSAALDRGDATFGGGVAEATRRAREATGPESTLARELSNALLDGDDLRERLRETFEALDAAERVRAKLDGVDPESVTSLAGSVRSSLDDDGVVESTLAERVDELGRQAEGDDLLAYAARQELRFYDRTLLPRLQAADAEASAEGDDAAGRIASVRERRDEMRSSFPREYDECNHEIPVLFLETAADLLDEAETAADGGDPERAVGVATATDALLDSVETLYHRDAYYTLLRRLRA